MSDDFEGYEFDYERLSPGLRRHLLETIRGEFPEKVYETSLVDDNGEEYDVEVTARKEGDRVIRIVERDSRYSEMDPPIEGHIDTKGYRIIVDTNKIPYSLRGELDPNRSIREQVEGEREDLITEAVQRFIVGANYRVGVGEITEEENQEYQDNIERERKDENKVPYNRREILEDLLKVIIILGSGLSAFWLFSSQRITAKFVSATGLSTSIVYRLLTFIIVLGLTLFLINKNIEKK
ncbi:MAG: hypothetical protein GF368_05185 [Candidatus Aenigmarchaeota archaeon]|nr:hypothetical protein [Candidatus Aenigmarchaeota archaeon]